MATAQGTLGGRIRELREARGWKVRELAARADVPESTIYRVEAGIDCKTSTLVKIAAALGVKPGRLVG